MRNRTYYSREAQDRAVREEGMSLVSFLMVGLAIGAVIALLVAPKEGKKLRQEIAGNFQEGLNSGRDASLTALQRLEKEFAELRKQVDDRLNDL
jgi:gas vesicle protein